MDRARGFLILDEPNVFIFCCARCPNEFKSSSELETHILLDCMDGKGEVESVFVEEKNVFDSVLNTDIENQSSWFRGINQQIKEEAEVMEDFSDVFEPEYDEMIDVKMNLVSGSESESEPALSTLEIRELLVQKRPMQLDPKKYYCEMCPFDKVNFTSKKKLVKHMSEHHMTQKELKCCPICKERTKRLVHHMKTQHDGKRPYQCTMCKRSCDSEYLLAKHIRTHTGERPFLCSTCGKAFKENNALKEHIKRLHGKVLPYPCKDCDESFRYPSQFEHHRLNVHCDKRPHICDVCGKGFTKTKTLHNHKFTHKEKSFPCKYCGNLYKTNDYKRHHEQKVHEAKETHIW